MNNNNWTFKDGISTASYPSFPTAFRAMYQTIKTGVEKGRKYNDMVKQMVIIAPTKDQHGDFRQYNYTDAAALATSSGLMTPAGEINSREFKKR